MQLALPRMGVGLIHRLLLCSLLAVSVAASSAVGVSLIYSDPSDGLVAVGGEFKLEVYATGNQSTYTWFKDGQPLSGPNDRWPRLSRLNATVADSGEYFVVVANAGGAVTSRVERVQVSPTVLNRIVDETLYKNTHDEIWVAARFHVPTTFYWYFNGVLRAQTTDDILNFRRVAASDAGSYHVIASNIHGTVTSEPWDVTVAERFSARVVGSTNLVRVGEIVELDVEFLGSWSQRLQWYRNGKALRGEMRQYLFVRAERPGRSRYSVTARDESGRWRSESIDLEVVEAAPVFEIGPYPRSAIEGEMVVLPARAVGSDDITYEWRRNGETIATSGSTLIFQQVNRTNAGAYDVLARNELGETTWQFNLEVTGRTPLNGWTWESPRPQGARLKAITYGAGRYVAVGQGSAISSADGVHWDNVALPAREEFNSIAFGNGMFVAAADSASGVHLGQSTNRTWTTLLIVSSNGMDWRAVASPRGDLLRKIVFWNGKFYARSAFQEFLIYSSADGVEWEVQQVQFPGAQLDRAGDMLVAYSYDWRTGLRDFHSTRDGSRWRADKTVQPAEFSPGDLAQIAGAYGRFIAVTDNGRVFTSRQGTRWTCAPTRIDSFTPKGVAYGPSGFVAISDDGNGRAAFSTNETNWTQMTIRGAQDLEAITYAGDQYVAVGAGGTVVRSSDGINWQLAVGDADDLYGVASGAGALVVVGQNGRVRTAVNGGEWVAAPTAVTEDLHDVHFGNGLFVAVGESRTVLSSTDGMEWTPRDPGVNADLQRVHYGGGKWLAVGENGICTVSDDAINWTPFVIFPQTEHEGVAYGDGRWVVVGGYFTNTYSGAAPTIFTSTDLANWDTGLGLTHGKRMRDVAFGNGQFVAVGNDGVICVSSNGLTWTKVNTGGRENYRRVIFADNQFVVVGNEGVCVSSFEPQKWWTWQAHRLPTTQNAHSIARAADGRLVVTGNNGMILRSAVGAAAE